MMDVGRSWLGNNPHRTFVHFLLSQRQRLLGSLTGGWVYTTDALCGNADFTQEKVDVLPARFINTINDNNNPFSRAQKQPAGLVE